MSMIQPSAFQDGSEGLFSLPHAVFPLRQRRMFVDVSVLHDRDDGTGIQRVVRAIWFHLSAMQLSSDWAVHPVFATKQHGYRIAGSDFLLSRADNRHASEIQLSPGAHDIFVGLDLAPGLVSRHEQQLAEWKRNGVVIAMIVYDLLAITKPAWFTRRNRSNMKKWLAVLTRQADHAICISDSIANELKRLLDDKNTVRERMIKISSFPLGSDIIHSGASQGIDDLEVGMIAALSGKPFAMMVGTIEPRKGHAAVLAAFEHLWSVLNSDMQPILVIVGRPGWRTALLQRRLQRHPKRGKQLYWFTNASDEVLLQLYRQCQGVIIASYGEGFGLPLVEALAQGCSVLARDIPIFREIGEEAVNYFNSDNPVTLGAAINDMIVTGRSNLIAMPSNAVISWKECTEHLLRELGVIGQNALDCPEISAT